MSNTFGHLFRVTTFGESHGGGVGVVIDGCPLGWKFLLTKYSLSWIGVAPVKAKSPLRERKRTAAKFCQGCLKGKRWELPFRFWYATKTSDRRTTTRWPSNIAHPMLMQPTMLSMAFETGREVDVPRRGKRSVEWLRGDRQKNFASGCRGRDCWLRQAHQGFGRHR